nr:hypothetical protein [Tanacetum cinerariifolium]
MRKQALLATKNDDLYEETAQCKCVGESLETVPKKKIRKRTGRSEASDMDVGTNMKVSYYNFKHLVITVYLNKSSVDHGFAHGHIYQRFCLDIESGVWSVWFVALKPLRIYPLDCSYLGGAGYRFCSHGRFILEIVHPGMLFDLSLWLLQAVFASDMHVVTKAAFIVVVFQE